LKQGEVELVGESQELLDTFDRIKGRMIENVEPDGTCNFNVQHMKWMLQLLEKTLEDSVETYNVE
jgi:hypothetical protein